jgi:uncharacterized alpha-E superfamily protein
MLLARLAESTFWLARYVERAEDLSRAVTVCEQLRLDMPGAEPPGWQRLAAVAGVDAAAPGLAPTALLHRVLLDRGNPSSLLGALTAARENLRRTRMLLPSECWHTFNPVFLRIDALDPGAAPGELAEVLAQVVGASQQLAGQVAAGMLRDEGYAFLRIGVHLERADMMLRIAAALAESLIPVDHAFRFEDLRWAGLLKSVGAYQAYRRRHQARADLARAFELLLLDAAFPRSFAHCVQQIGRELDGLPRNGDALAALHACALPAVPATRAALDGVAEQALERLGSLGEAIHRTYFSPHPPPSLEEAAAPGKRLPSRHTAPASTTESTPRPDVAQT